MASSKGTLVCLCMCIYRSSWLLHAYGKASSTCIAPCHVWMHRAAIIPARVDGHWTAVLQTAHEPSYLVKHLLGSLPPVVERVKLMRKGQAPNGSSEDNLVKMAQSQVGHSMQLLLPCPSVCRLPCFHFSQLAFGILAYLLSQPSPPTLHIPFPACNHCAMRSATCLDSSTHQAPVHTNSMPHRNVHATLQDH